MADTKPFSYLFINLLLADLQASFPALLAQLNSPKYPSISQRLGAAFDILSSFIGFLVRSLDEDNDIKSFTMPPDLLLKLRKDIAETMSLTIEYLRDRWDASIAGASGLHPSARTGTAATSEGTRLTLTWDSMKVNVKSDPLVLAGIRALAIWIREDENENLRSETAGLMDMLIDLYKSHEPSDLDFRYPILLALEGIIITEDGIDAFLEQDGWQTLFKDLQSIARITSDPNPLGSQTTPDEAVRGLQVIRVLLAVLDHEETPYPEESWMFTVTATAAMKIPSSAPPPVVLEFQIGMLQLSVALLTKSSGGMTRRYLISHPALAGIQKQLSTFVGEMDDKVEAADLKGLLDDVALDLENLRM
jgi:hypothetical protein